MSQSSSARLLNYTEPVVVNGVTKTAFYSEHSIDINVGDKLFILNGNYDSDSYPYKYARNSKFVDGYRVLGLDRCKIVLDIDWDSSTSVYKELEINEFIKIWNVRTNRELYYYENITVDLYGSKVNRYSYRQTNDIIYIDKSFDLTDIPVGKFKYNKTVGSVTTLENLTDPRGHFFGFNNGSWIEDDFRFTYNQYSPADFQFPYNLTNNGKMYIIGEDIIIDSDHIYRQRSVYKYTGDPNEYVIDIEYKKPLISKLNFRGGIFKGNYNDGVFGTYLAPISWESNGVWNGGFFVNSNWISGEMRSNITPGEVFKAYMDNGKVIQISDLSSNNSFGYNYVIDSTIESGVILSGNFENCNIGGGLSSSVNGYEQISNVTSGIDIYGGYYELCDIDSVDIESATLSSSNVLNSEILNSRLIDSQIESSYIKGCDLFENSGITIKGAEIMCDWLVDGIVIRPITSVGGLDGVFEHLSSTIKMWISEEDYYKLNSLDSFFITKMNKSYFLSNLTTDELIKLPIETEVILDRFYNLDLSDKPLLVTLKTNLENRFFTSINLVGSNFDRVSSQRIITEFSIDIQINGDSNASYGKLGYYYNNDVKVIATDNNTNNNKLVKLDIDRLMGTSVVSNFNIKSGLVDSSKWISGSNMNHPALALTTIDILSSDIIINISNYNILERDYLKVGDNVWLDGVTYNGSVFRDALVIKAINTTTGLITLMGINGVTYPSGVFSLRTSPNLSYLAKVKITDTEINGGFFIGTMFQKSVFNVNKYENTENITLDNINKMRVINSYFDYGLFGNTINSGIFHKSNFITGTTVKGGIVSGSKWYNSSLNIFNGGVFTNGGNWNNGTFSSGVFTKSIWNNGIFEDGTFKDNSTWNLGNFKGGNFFNSIWGGGIIDGGIFGNTAYNVNSTQISGVTQINDVTVINAIFGGPDLIWNNGTFNGGQFIGGVWNNGTFNGGEFTGGIWNNGTFNGGKFISLEPTQFAWNNGTFNGGEFGNKKGYGFNPSWKAGLFQGGVFQGHTWDSGTFTSGIFQGGKWEVDTEGDFVNSVYDESYKYLDMTSSSVQYGIWNSGIVVNNKFEVLVDEYTYDNTKKTRGGTKTNNYVEFDSMLWKTGTFVHPNGHFNNSVWFGGDFKNGFVLNSFINPYVRRTWGATSGDFGISTWYGGVFNSGEMYKTNWIDGTFNDGAMWGSIWRNGTWNYGNANGILWLGGRWRNGNWNGSPYDSLVSMGTNKTVNAYSKALIKFVNDEIKVNTITTELVNKVHVNNFCRYKLMNSGDGNTIGNYINFPSDWYTSGNVMAVNTLTVPASTSTEEFRLNVTYCDDVKCYDDADLFLDAFYGYRIVFSFGASSSDVYIHLNIGELKDEPNIDTLAPGAQGFDIDGTPVIRLDNVAVTASYTYYPNLSDTNRSLSYQIKNTSSSSKAVNIIGIDVTRIKTEYDPLNNTLLNFNVDTNEVNFPSTAFTNINVENGNVVKFKYGNGTFAKGVWENGAWNDGYRVDGTIRLCESVSDFIQITEFVYIISLAVNGSLSIYSIGDKVSVSNIVGIDYNNKRKLIKGSLVIRDIQPSSSKIVLEVVSNYKLRLIKQDSNNHLIKVTQNVWLSGAFLNGQYNGVMNYGIISGFPYITQLSNIHMIDGIFDGGKIGGAENVDTLVQNFTFYDNVVIKRNFYNTAIPISKPISDSSDRFYRSWAAFRYINDNSYVNIYSNDTIYDDKWHKTTPVLNLSGRATNDVISSRSRFMNLSNIDQRTYDLGVDSEAYNEFIPLDGLFTYPFKVGADNQGETEFENNGWEYKTISGSVLPQLTANYINSNVNNSNIMFVDVPSGGSFVLNNNGKNELYYDINPKIDPERYSVIEFQLRDYKSTSGTTQYDPQTPMLFFGNAPIDYSINKSIINHVTNNNVGKVRYEYFYNRKALDMYLLGNSAMTNYEFKSINFDEVDMIPFFNYFSDSNTTDRIDDSAKAPKYIPAPKIDYSDDFDFIDNITSTIDISSLNIPPYTILSEPVEAPLLDEPTIDITNGTFTITWLDPAYVANITSYEITYGQSYPYSTPIIVDRNQMGAYTFTSPSLTANTVPYSIRIRSVGNKAGQYSSYVLKDFVFVSNRTPYYTGFSGPLVTNDVQIQFIGDSMIYADTAGKTYINPYTFVLANKVDGRYRVMTDTEFNSTYTSRNSYGANMYSNILTTDTTIAITSQVIYDVPGFDWANGNNNPPPIANGMSVGAVTKGAINSVNTTKNITVGDRLYTAFDSVNNGYPKASSSRWIAIRRSWTSVGFITPDYHITYIMVRLNADGVVTDVIPNLVFITPNPLLI